MKSFTQNSKILIVDDSPDNINLLTSSLDETYIISVAVNGADAMNLLLKGTQPDLILLDIVMPGMDGFEVCRLIKENPQTETIPIIFLTASTDINQKTKGFELGAVDYITKPFDIREVIARVENHLIIKYARDVLKDQNQALENLVKKRMEQVLDTQSVTIRMAASLAETRDNETGLHLIRTQNYVEVLANAMSVLPLFSSQLTRRNIDLIVNSAPLHDVGKIGVPDNILLKPGNLDHEEFEEMKKHTIYGFECLCKAEDQIIGESFLRYAREIAYSHHEKWDGTGYPQGLKGESIPLSGRIMAIADVYDALITERVYKSRFSHTKAVSIIKEGKGTHFDPVITDCFLSIHNSFRQIALRYAETKEEKSLLMS